MKSVTYGRTPGFRELFFRESRPNWYMWLLLAVYLTLAFARCRTNLPWVDEGWFFDPVYNWLTHGHTGTTVMVGKGFPVGGH